jgi:YidC/Oxa1 family membrane protein insertase
MQKRFLLAIVLSVAVLMAYQLLFPPKQRYKTPSSSEKPQQKSEVPVPVPALPADSNLSNELILTPLSQLPEDKDIIIETPLIKTCISPYGAKIKSFKLKKIKETQFNIKKITEDIKNIELKKLNLKVEEEDVKARIYSAKTKDEREKFEKTLENLKFQRESLENQKDKLEYIKELYKRDSLENLELISFSKNLSTLSVFLPALDPEKKVNKEEYIYRSKGHIKELILHIDKFRITKQFIFSPDSYWIDFKIRIKNTSSEVLKEKSASITYGPNVGLIEIANARVSLLTPIISRDGNLDIETVKKGFFKSASVRPGSPQSYPKHGEKDKHIDWISLNSQYFCVAMAPSQHKIKKAQYSVNSLNEVNMTLHLPPLSIGPGREKVEEFKLYMGPKTNQDLQEEKIGLEKIVIFGKLAFIAKPIYAILKFIYKIIGNFGWAIVILSLLIKIIFYPLTKKSMEAMQKVQEDMKKLQPELNALKEKYKGNPQKLNKETMALYKKHKTNPLAGCKGGCLPMLLQMPIFFALYSVLNSAIELRYSNFLWIKDLSSSDIYFPYTSYPMPFGIGFMVIIMGASMFLQQKMTTAAQAQSGTPEQKQQAKMMGLMMPVMMIFIFKNLASGVVLYWCCFNIFTIFQQLFTKKLMPYLGRHKNAALITEIKN